MWHRNWSPGHVAAIQTILENRQLDADAAPELVARPRGCNTKSQMTFSEEADPDPNFGSLLKVLYLYPQRPKQRRKNSSQLRYVPGTYRSTILALVYNYALQ